MARKKIQGITIEIGGDTTKLQTALKGVEGQLKDTQDALKDTQKLLKLDPGNVELLSQKQRQLTDAIEGTEKKLRILKDAAKDAEQQLADGSMSQAQFDALQREIVDTEQQLKSLTGQMEEFGSVSAQQIAAAGGKVKEVGDKMTKAGETMTKYVTAPIVAVGAASVAAFNEVDEGLDILVKKTGAGGEALADMEERVKNLATSIPTDFRTAGEAVGEVNTRFGLMGDALEDTSKKFIEFAQLNDTTVSASIDSVQAAMAAFNVDAGKAGPILDMLNKAGQETGIDMSKLAGDLTANAAALQEMGFGINSATGFLANLNKNGLDASQVMTGLKTALKNATKDGKSMKDALAELTGKIRGAKSETKAMQIATELFGGKAAPAMVKAIREGRLSFDQLANTIEDWNGSVENTFEATLDPIDQFKTALNELKIVGMDLVSAAAPMIKSVAEALKNLISGLRTAWEGLSPQMQETIIKLAGVAAAVGPVLVVGGKLVSGIGSLMQLAPQLVSGFQAVQGALSALWGVLAANPVGAVIAALVAIGAALVTLYNKCEWFRNAVDAVGRAIRDGVLGFVDWFKNALNGVGDFLGNLAQSALNWGKDLIDNFINGIKQKISDLKNAVSNVAQTVKDFLGFSEPKEGPLSNFHTFAPDMVDLFIKGLKDNQQRVANQLAQTFTLPEQAAGTASAAAGAQAGAGEFTTPLSGAQGATIAPVLVLDGQVVGRVLLPSLRNEEYRLGVQLAR